MRSGKDRCRFNNDSGEPEVIAQAALFFSSSILRPILWLLLLAAHRGSSRHVAHHHLLMHFLYQLAVIEKETDLAVLQVRLAKHGVLPKELEAKIRGQSHRLRH